MTPSKPLVSAGMPVYNGERLISQALDSVSGKTYENLVAISSLMAGNGKTSTPINLAGALAQTPGKCILLLKADLRCPSMAGYLGFGHASGLGLAKATLELAVSVADVVLPYPPFNRAILRGGRLSAASHDLLKSLRFGEPLDEARRC